MAGPRLHSERRLLWMLRLYPPFLFQRVSVVSIEPGFLGARVRVRQSLLTRNLEGSTFGGTLFAALDPIYPVLLWQALAHRGQAVQAWHKAASIRYRRPARSDVTLDFALDQSEVEAVERELAEAGRCDREYEVQAVDQEGIVCALATTTVALRRPGPAQAELAGF